MHHRKSACKSTNYITNFTQFEIKIKSKNDDFEIALRNIGYLKSFPNHFRSMDAILSPRPKVTRYFIPCWHSRWISRASALLKAIMANFSRATPICRWFISDDPCTRIASIVCAFTISPIFFWAFFGFGIRFLGDHIAEARNSYLDRHQSNSLRSSPPPPDNDLHFAREWQQSRK